MTRELLNRTRELLILSALAACCGAPQPSSHSAAVVGQVHRVAIVGPGLDFTDKAEGYDFYPVQTIQPFALADSLMRVQLAAPDLTISTFDLSPRVNAHLSAAPT